MTPNLESRFNAVVLVDEVPDLTLEAVRSEVATIMPALAGIMTPDELGIDTLTFSMGPVAMTRMIIGTPMPAGEFKRALAMAERRWPESASAVSAHRAHIIVGTLKPATNWQDAARHAGFITAVAAAITRLSKARAVYFPTAETLTPPEKFRELACGFTQDRLPHELWVQLIPMTITDRPTGKVQNALMTEGLRSFAGREIEFAPSDVPVGDLATRALSLAQELIMTGVQLVDGKTFGLNADELFRIRFKDRGIRDRVPIIKLTPENFVSGLVPGQV